MFETIIENVREKHPIVHCITNYVTVNDVANIILASGGSPIMADEIEEVTDITSISKSLIINIGTINSRTIEAMLKAGKEANKLNIPVVLDPGGMTSKFRSDSLYRLLSEVKFSVIRCHPTELKAIFSGTKSTSGIDADPKDVTNEDNLESYISMAKSMSKTNNSIVVVTGPIYIITDSEITYVIRNGHPYMRKIRGSGCMLSGLIGSYIGANSDKLIDSVAAAVASIGISAEYAFRKTDAENKGAVSFRAFMIDYISLMDSGLLNSGMNIEKRN
jgi:hydroxyethylthiazole kinase